MELATNTKNELFQEQGAYVTHQVINLDLNTDVTEWCPTPNWQSVLAVGTYQLNQETKIRDGRLYLYNLCSDGASPSPALHLQQSTTLDMPGIFDLRWDTSSQSPILAAALADGSVRLFQHQALEENMTTDGSSLQGDRAAPPINLVPTASSPPLQDSMAVSVDFYNALSTDTTSNQPSDRCLAGSFSCGSLQLFQLTPSALISLQRWQGHDLEAWAAAGDLWNPSVIYSGGDDCAFKAWDTRQECSESGAVWVNRKTHTAGVCCIASSPYQEHVVCTGSYDEKVRLWDTRMTNRPVYITEVCLTLKLLSFLTVQITLCKRASDIGLISPCNPKATIYSGKLLNF